VRYKADMKQAFLGALLASAAAGPTLALGSGPEDWMGDWRVVQAQPLCGLDLPTDRPALPIGLALRLQADGIDAPPPLGCRQMRVQKLSLPVEGLFQGMLATPDEDAGRLGLRPPVTTLRIDCSSGSWDFHAADSETLLFALDLRIYSLSRALGSLAPAESPAAAVQTLLEQHFAGTRSFSREAWAPLREGLCGGLAATVDAYFEAGWPEDEVPPVNGDPLSDSQEPPARFAVAEAQSVGAQAEVAVRFADAHREHTTTFLMQREQGAWRVCDLRYADGSHLSRVLSEQPR
jgi:hypothetical protein